MHRVIILAGGGTRKGWTPEHPKVMAKVEGRPIVLRVVLQVKKRGYVPIVLTSFLQVIKAVSGECACYWPEPWVGSSYYREMPVGGVKDSIPIWNANGRTTLLCADTAYTPEALDKILADEAPISVWGTVDEIYGITFLPERTTQLVDAVGSVLQSDCIGHLWTIYRALYGSKNLNAHKFDDVIFKGLERGSYLFDCDSVEKYEKWLKNNPWAQKE